MAIWGVDKGTIDEERLSKLGLICYGGGTSKKGGTTYKIHGKNTDFFIELEEYDFKNNLDKIYTRYLRKIKIDKINESLL